MCQPQAKLSIKLRRSSFATFGLKVDESTLGKRLLID
jgi:hypothetical protein